MFSNVAKEDKSPKEKISEPKKRKFIVPHTYAILFFIILLSAAATYILTPGEFEREVEETTGRTVVIPGSYHTVDANPVSFFDIFKAIPTGLQDASNIVFYIFLVGGAFGIIRATGAIEVGIERAVVKLEGRERLLIPCSMFIFSIGGFSFGMAEESMIFVPIGVALARALGFDAITGTAMISLGAASGFIGGMLNPFTVGIAQEFAELPLFSGIVFRFCVYLLILLFGMWYVSRYAFKVKENPEKSPMYEIEQNVNNKLDEEKIKEVYALTFNHYLVFAVIFLGLSFNIYGVFKWDWYIDELAASFLIIGLLAGLVGRLSINEIFDSFVSGAKALAFGALIVGFARAILVILEQGAIIDTVIVSLAGAIQHLPHTLTALGMFGVQSFINFFIPAGPAQAATTMPVMVPVSDLVGISRQVAVLAFQYGDSISNSIIPTSGSLMGVLAVAGVPYDKWVKFVWKLVLAWMVIAAVAIFVAVLIGLQ